MDTPRSNDITPYSLSHRSAEVRHNQIMTAAAFGLAAVISLGVVETQNRNHDFAQYLEDQDHLKAVSNERKEAIIELAMETPDPADIITTFTISDENQSITQEAKQALESQGIEYSENVEETILVSANAHEADFTQEGEKFAIVQKNIGNEVVFVVEAMPEKDS